MLDAYYAHPTNGALRTQADETYAQANPVFVISGNESVGVDGKLPMEVKDSYNKTAKIEQVFIKDKKENWANGKADIAYTAYHTVFSNCTKTGNPFSTDFFIKISNSQLNNWVTVTWSTAEFANEADKPLSLWNVGENILILFYEHDIRQKFARTDNGYAYIGCTSCQNNPNFNFYYISKETPYGFANLDRVTYHNPSPGATSLSIIEYGYSPCVRSMQLDGAKFKIKTQNVN